MKVKSSNSFRRRLYAGFLAVSLIPLLICSSLLLQIARFQLTRSASYESEQSLSTLMRSFDKVISGFSSAAARIDGAPALSRGLSAGQSVNDTELYSLLFAATDNLRPYAWFELYDCSGAWRYSTQSGPSNKSLPTNWGVLKNASKASGFSFTSTAVMGGRPLLQGAYPLSNAGGSPAGYLVVSMTESHFRQLWGDKFDAQSNLLLMDAFWRPIYGTQPALVGKVAPELRSRLLSGQSLKDYSDDYLYHISRHPETGLTLVLQQPQVFTPSTMTLLYSVSFLFALLCIAISVLMSSRLSRQFSRPIENLQRAFGEVAQNNLDVSVTPVSDDELGQLSRQFNGMVVDLKHNQRQLVENQRELNEAQIRMLQAQLNPHFLCNTLDTMKWISKINSVPQVALMSTNLADILRHCISPDQFIPLSQELEILDRYMEIQKIRLSDGFTYHVDCPADLMDCLVPKMMLQPLVENAILHGIDGISGGRIEIVIDSSGGVLRIDVRDNGGGLPPEMLGLYERRERPESHLGLYNVNTILQKHYGSSFGLTLSNRAENSGAIITATLPINY